MLTKRFVSLKIKRGTEVENNFRKKSHSAEKYFSFSTIASIKISNLLRDSSTRCFFSDLRKSGLTPRPSGS